MISSSLKDNSQSAEGSFIPNSSLHSPYRGINLPIPQSSPSYQHPSICRISHPATLTANRSFQVFLLKKKATVKLRSIYTIHVKQQHNAGFFIFKFTLKYILVGNVFINKKHARQCLYIISLYYREGFIHPFNFFVISKGIPHV